MNHIVIVGGNAAGATCAASLRDEGFDGSITVIGDEPLPPYERPPLSKNVLRGEAGGADLRFRDDGFWASNDVTMRLGQRVSSIADRAVRVDGQAESVPYDTLVLATGVRPRRLDIPGWELGGVHTLRTAADAERIRHAAIAATRAVIVGFGFIGAEVAASLRSLGLDVTIIEPASTAMQRILGVRFGRVIEAIHRDHGVGLILDDAPLAFEGGDRVERVTTQQGKRIEADLVVVGVGTQPNDELATAAGLATDRGVLVDASLHTSNPQILAIGDVAAHDHPVFGRIRVEHLDNAQHMGQHAAANIARDTREPFADPHWFWSDQYDTTIQMSGFTTAWEDPVIRGDFDGRAFSAYQLDADGRLTAAVGINANRDIRRSLKIIGQRVDPGALVDPDVDLRDLTESPPKGL